MEIFNWQCAIKASLHWLSTCYVICALSGCGGFPQDLSSITGGNSAAAKTQWSNSIILDLPKRGDKSHNKNTSCACTKGEITKASKSVNSSNKNVYLQASVARTKTSAVDVDYQLPQLNQEIDLYRPIRAALLRKGYDISNAPEEAAVILQVRLRQAGVINNRVVQLALNQGYGVDVPDLTPDPTEDVINAGQNNSDKNNGNGNGLINFFAAKKSELATKQEQDRSKNKDQVFSMIFDIQVLAYQRDVGWMRHQTRLVTTSNKIQAPFADMVKQLTEYTAKQIVAIF